MTKTKIHYRLIKPKNSKLDIDIKKIMKEKFDVKRGHITIDKINDNDKRDSTIYLMSTLLLDFKKQIVILENRLSKLEELHKSELKDFL